MMKKVLFITIILLSCLTIGYVFFRNNNKNSNINNNLKTFKNDTSNTLTYEQKNPKNLK